MAQEVELKLAIPAGSLRALKQHPLVKAAAAQGRAQTLYNTYFDTPQLDLRAARVAVRTRRVGKAVLQTIKCAASSVGGLSSRPEWEQPMQGDRFDFTPVTDPAARRLLEKHADVIAPVFDTTFRRETRIASPSPGVQIALMIDTGSILSAGREAPISELELELVSGNASDLLDFALLLCTDLPLLPEDASKAERGFALFTQAPLKPAHANRSPINAAQSPHQAFLAMAYTLLRDWQINARGLREREDAEFVHQLRVSLRRLRTLLRVFKGVLPDAFVQRWTHALGQLANEIGETRDLEVLRDELLGDILAAGYDEGSAALARRAEDEARLARAQACTLLQLPAIGQLPLHLTRELMALPEPAEAPELQKFARQALEKLRKQAQRQLALASTLEAEAIHSLRLRLKRLRYALEFFAPLFNAGRIERALRATAKVQSQLGYWNDLNAASLRLAEWSDADPALAPARAFALGFHAREAQRQRDKGLAAATALLENRRPWRKEKKEH